MKNIGLVKMMCIIAANVAVAANQFKAKLANAANNRATEDYGHRVKRSKGYGSRSCYAPHYGTKAAARNLRHMNLGTCGMCWTGFVGRAA